jgi:predicted NBD/HSP70 family sugar kinase
MRMFTVVTTNRAPGLRSEAVRESNLSTILRELHGAGTASRTDLVERTGLTRSSVHALVGELASFGLVAEERPAPDGSPGRPSTVVRADPTRNVVLAIEVLVDSLAVAAFGLGGVEVHAEHMERPRDRTTPEQTVVDVGDLYRRVVAMLDPACAVYSVGIAAPGLVRQSDQMVVLAPNVGWKNLPLPAMLLNKCGLDLPVVVDNEAALAALAETRRGAAINLDSVLCVWGEVGIGGGIVSDGQLMKGASGFAGEIGHLPINLDGVLCRCGAIGCLETELGEESLLRRAGRQPDGGRAALTALFADAAAGVPGVIEALAEQGRWLGIGLAGVINLLDPNVVVLGGYLGEAMPFLVESMHVELDARSIAAIGRSLSVVPGACGPHAPLMGAAELAWESVIANPIESLDHRVLASELH